MNWDAIGAVGEILGAIGVIASLVYLSVQIRRSDQTARAQSLQSVLDGHRDRTLLPAYTNPEFADLVAMGLTNLQQLNSTQKRQFQAYMGEIVIQMQQTMQLNESGLLPKVDFDAWLFYTATLIKSPGGADMWSQVKVTMTPTIRDLIDKFIGFHNNEMIDIFKESEEQMTMMELCSNGNRYDFSRIEL
jgi:hypothetical protein